LTLILIFIVIIIIDFVFDQPLTGCWANSGITVLIIGFALRNMILDLFSGIAINIEKPYKIGDWMEIHHRMATEKVVGEVVKISWKAAHIRDENNSIVVVPNSILTTMVINTNFGEMSLLLGETRSASIKTAFDAVVDEIMKESFDQLLATSKAIIVIIGAQIAERKLMNDKILNSMNEREYETNRNNDQKSLIHKIKEFFGVI
jgi:small-conductance mechanosensitive channel